MANHTVTLELFYSGSWHPAPVYTRDGLSIMRGASTPGAQTPPGSVELTIDNRTGNYSPRNVSGALYGLLTQNMPARVTVDSDVRITGEVALWKPERAIRGDAWTKIQVVGILQRIGRGTDPLRSAATRAGLALDPFAYWALESTTGALTPNTAALVPGADPSIPPIEWADDATLVGSLPLPRVLTETSEWDVSVLATNGVPTNSGAAWSISVWLRQEPLQDAVPDTWFPFYWEGRPPGANQPWSLQTSTSGNNSFGYTAPGGAVATNHGPDLTDGAWHHVVMMAQQAGATISGQLYIDGVAGTTLTPATDTLLPITSFEVFPATGFSIATPGANIWAGGLGFYDRVLTADEVEGLYLAGHGWVGETADDRFLRLCDEEDIDASIVGTADDTVLMGPQLPGTLLQLFAEIERTDDATIFEDRDSAALIMRTGASKLNQAPDLTLYYNGKQVAPPLEVVVGDEHIRNDVTAASPGGASRRVQQLTGTYNVQAPPSGVGRYATRIDVNPETDDALSDAAGWRINHGTYDGTWYATITVDLDAAPLLATLATAIDIGDCVSLAGLPVDEALDSVEHIVIGIKEDVPPKRRTITYYCVPAAPYQVGVLSTTSGDTGAFLGHLDPDGSTTNGSVAAGATSFSVATPSGPLWTTAADDFPFDVVVGGQRVSISAISGAASPQTFTVQSTGRKVRYAIASGSAVTDHQPIILAQ